MRPRPRYVWGTAAALVGISGALIVTNSGSPEGSSADSRPGPVEARTRTAALETGERGDRATLKRDKAAEFSLLGVTWTDPRARVEGTIEARTRAVGSGKWSSWLSLDGDSGQGEMSARRGGSEPAWVGASDGVEVRVVAGGQAKAGLPAGLRLDMIDPGEGGGTTRGATEGTAQGATEGTAQGATQGSAQGIAQDTAQGTAEGTAQGAAKAQPASFPADMQPVAFRLDGDDPEESPSPTPEPPESTEPSPSESAPGEDETTPTPTEPSAPESPASTPPASPSVEPSPSASAPSAPPSTAPRPAIVSRASWGADETLSPDAPGYLPGEKVKAVVVHHTAESNDYTCAQGPALVRGIYAYHVKQLGWKDLGYNFLVDKCGTVYEGRKGGVDRPVMGAHSYGFNAETSGISILGTYTSVTPSQAALASVSRVAAWKLGQYGVSPTATTTLTAGSTGSNYAGKKWSSGAKLTLPTLHGHRDSYNTQCPGNQLYAQLPTLRTWAAGPVTGLTAKSVTGAGVSAGTYYTKSTATLNWTSSTPSSLITKHELLVDGKAVTSTAGTATSAQAALALGSHRLQVRATHQSGLTTTSAAVMVVAETTAPTFPTRPTVTLRTGTVDTAAVPVKLTWKAADSAALKEVRLTAPAKLTYGPAVTSANSTAKSGSSTTWSLTAHDQAGNTATAATSATPVILQETAATRTGNWTTKSSSSYLGGKSYSSSTKNASLTWTFTGRSVSWITSRAATSGQAVIYLDGKKITTLDLKSATTKYRDAPWTHSWPTSARHTLKIEVLGTAGRPAVTTDGIAYLK
ncbi:N-acetylmuramoyl-L-alanine amidase [Streptomyces sp. NPDC004539]|uniref:N-acetylmuramoyl-L-alanine amidase n=1 Tax=Streptomyces sp. NPDC004539 TaxID=3154280 RepID=UPI0033AE6ED1